MEERKRVGKLGHYETFGTFEDVSTKEQQQKMEHNKSINRQQDKLES